MDTSEEQQWYKKLDISPKGKPTGYEQISGMPPKGLAYCIISITNTIKKQDFAPRKL